MTDITAIQQQLDQANMNVKTLVAQLEATKQMLNEQLAANLQLRTNLHIGQQDNQTIAQERQALQKQIDDLTQKLPDAQPAA